MATLKELVAERERRKDLKSTPKNAALDALKAERQKRINAQPAAANEAPIVQDAAIEKTGDPLPIGGLMDTITAPVMSIVSDAAGAFAGGVAGVATALTDGVDAGAERSENIQKTVGEFGSPDSQLGEWSTKKLGELQQFGVDVGNMTMGGLSAVSSLMLGKSADEANAILERIKKDGYSQVLGDEVLNKTDSPAAATIATMFPELLGAFIPAKAMYSGGKRLKAAQDLDIVNRLKDGGGHTDIAKYMVDGAGKIVGDPSIKPLANRGFDQGMLTAYKGSGSGTIKKLVDMVGVRRKGMKDSVYRAKNRASDVAGNSLIDRVNYVKKMNREAGKQIDTEAAKLKDEPVDFSEAINEFRSDLLGIGVTIDNSAKVKFDDRSPISKSPAAQKLIKDIVDYMSQGDRGVTPSAFELHQLKKTIDETVIYGKNKEGLAGQAERIVKDLRHDIDAVLDNNFPDYNKVNTQYADTIGALSDLQSSSGRTINFGGRYSDKALGTVLRGLTSNIRSRANLMESTDNIDYIANKYGGGFDDSLFIQMNMANDLDRIFGYTEDTSLGGIMSTTMEKAMDSGKGVKQKAFDAAIKGIKTPFNKSDAEMLDILEGMLKREPSRWEE